MGRDKIGDGGVNVERQQHLAVGARRARDLDHAGVEQLGKHDVAGEQAGPMLVADAQRVGEAGGDDECRRFAGVRAARWWRLWCPSDRGDGAAGNDFARGQAE